MLFLTCLTIVLIIESTQPFKSHKAVEDSKDYVGLDIKNVLKDVWQGKYNRRMNPLVVGDIRVFKIMKTNDEEKPKKRVMCRRHGMKRNRSNNYYSYMDKIDTRRDANDKNNTKNDPDDDLNDDDYEVNITTADTSIYSDADHSSVSINDPILRGFSENVVPNDIFITNEKDCANWHKDCNSMGVKNDLFKILWSRYNS